MKKINSMVIKILQKRSNYDILLLGEDDNIIIQTFIRPILLNIFSHMEVYI